MTTKLLQYPPQPSKGQFKYSKNETGKEDERMLRSETKRARVARGCMPLVVRRSTELRGIGAAAKKCGVSHTHLRKVLQGERVPSAELARKMSRLGLKPGMMKVEVA